MKKIFAGAIFALFLSCSTGNGPVGTGGTEDTGGSGVGGSSGGEDEGELRPPAMPPEASNPTLQKDLIVLASNVLFGDDASAAEAAPKFLRRNTSKELDTNIQVLAKNVLLDTSANNRLTSEDLQSALNTELAVDVSTAIVGMWSCTSYGVNTNGGNPPSIATLTFNSDSTWSTAGFFYIGCADSNRETGMSGHDLATTYEVVQGFIVLLNTTTRPAAANDYSTPLFVYGASDSKMILLNSTSCAASSGEGLGMAVCEKQ